MTRLHDPDPVAAGRPILRPLVPAAPVLAIGIIAGTFLPGHAVAAAVLFFLSAGSITMNVLRGRSALVAPLLLVAVAGYMSIQPWLGRELPDDHVGRYAGQGKWQVSGIVTDLPGSGDQQFTLQADWLNRGGPDLKVRGKIRVGTDEAVSLRLGDRVTVTGRLAGVRGFCNPGGFAYERHMALQGVHARLYAPAGRMRIEPALRTGDNMHLEDTRRVIGERMEAVLQDYSPAVRQLLRALTLGERGEMDPRLQDAFARAGVSHVLAISGLHIGMVALAAFAFFNRILAWMTPLLERGWVRRFAAALTLLPVAGYALLAGMSPSTQRALIMVCAFLLAFWIGRPRDWPNALALAALVILLVSPPALLSVSFQLSFAAVAAILMGMRRIGLPSPDPAAPLLRRWGIRLLVFTCVSLLAIWGTTPLVMRHFNQISWIGPLSNLLVVPLTGTLVVPAGLLGILFAPFSTLISTVCWKISALALSLIVAFVERVSAWEYAAVLTVTPSVPEMALFYLFSAVLLLWKNRPLRIAGLVIVTAAGTLDAAYWVQRRFASAHMTVTAIDVGQGSANVVQLPGGYIVLVDGGGFSDNNAFDIGRNVLAPYLLSNKIKTVDLIVLTHADSDHLNGLLYLVEKFRVRRIWSNHEPAQTLGYRRWQELIAERGIEHLPFDRLPAREAFGPVEFSILGPRADFLRHPAASARPDLNNNSMVVRVSLQDVSFLFTGDIKAAAEKELLSRHADGRLRSTVLFVPHHGSRSSTTLNFLREVRPAEGVIAAGWQNRFSFPHPDVLQRLEKAGCRTWRTDLCGAVTIRTDGKSYQVQTCRQACSEQP